MSNLKVAEVSNVKKGFISACEFDAKFSGMRKPQNFIVYPVKEGDSTIIIQSETRIGELNLESGVCRLSGSKSGGAHFLHLAMAEEESQISSDDLSKIKSFLNLNAKTRSVVIGEAMEQH